MRIFVNIEGQTGPVETPRRGFFRAMAFNWDGIRRPTDVATGLATGARLHGPFSLTRDMDAATPVFFDSILKNAPLLVTVAADAHNPTTNDPVPNATYTLASAAVSRIVLSAVRGGGDQVNENVEMVYATIEVKHDPSLGKFIDGPGATKS